MHNRNIELSAEAALQLDALLVYGLKDYTEDTIKASERALRKALALLAFNPESHPIDRSTGYRKRRIKNTPFTVLYSATDTTLEVKLILRRQQIGQS